MRRDFFPLRSTFSALSAALLAIMVGAPLTGCASADRVVADPAVNADYRARHPLALVEGSRGVDIFPEIRAGKLDARSLAQIRQFARDAREARAPGVMIRAPRRDIATLAQALRHAGAPSPIGSEAFYPADFSATRAVAALPVRLSFRAVEAKVLSRCGQWPDDLASGGTLDGWQNRPWRNFGCASQTMLAVQVADPRDLAGPAATTPPDAALRQHAFDALRQGKDPTVVWTTQNNATNGSGGGQ